MVTPAQHSFFRENGYVYLKGALAKSQVQPVKAHVLGELKRLKIWASGKTLSASMKQAPAFQQIVKLGQALKYPGLQARIITPELFSAMTVLTGAKLAQAHDAQLLVSLPNQGDWSLDALNWHVDISTPDPDRLPGIQAFVLVDDVKPRGGATLAIAGSHLLPRGVQGKVIREVFRDGGDIQAKVAAHHLSILEMVGQAGDAWLMDMRLLHTPSVNSTRSVRMMGPHAAMWFERALICRFVR